MNPELELPRREVWTGEGELLATLLCVIEQACATKGVNRLAIGRRFTA
jgi:hypothetical protein